MIIHSYIISVEIHYKYKEIMFYELKWQIKKRETKTNKPKTASFNAICLLYANLSLSPAFSLFCHICLAANMFARNMLENIANI